MAELKEKPKFYKKKKNLAIIGGCLALVLFLIFGLGGEESLGFRTEAVEKQI